MKLKLNILSLAFILYGIYASAQSIQVNDNYTAQQLVNTLVGNSCAQVSNISLNGWSGSSGSNSYGYFTAGGSSFPFSDGIILSTGFAASAPGPNNSLLSEGSTGWPGDTDLENALGVGNTINATILEFDFIPFTDEISFDYIFASEQYLTSIVSQNQCNYTDGFAFLLKEAGSTQPYRNLAVIPGTTTPVRVNTVRGQGVCPAANEQYFGGFNGANSPTNYNGQTVILKAQSAVVPGTTYHIKLVVADQGNNLYDSAIFLGGGSFGASINLGQDRLIANGNPVCNGQTVDLNAVNPFAMPTNGYQWYKDGAPVTGGENGIYTVTSPGIYTAEVFFSPTCSSQDNITIEYTTNPASGNYTIIQCDEDNNGLTLFNLDLAYNMLTNNSQGYTVIYYRSQADALNDINAITDTTAFQNTTVNQQIYVRVINPYGCSSISTITLTTSANGLTSPTPLATCDLDGNNDGLYNFDLTQKDAEILQGLPPNLQLQYFRSAAEALTGVNAILDTLSFENTVPGNQTIYARIYNGSDCFGIVELPLIVYTFNFEDENAIICSGSNKRLDAGSGFTTYSWDTTPVQTSQSILVNEPGVYTVTVSNAFGCTRNRTFTVTPSGAVTSAYFDINDFSSNNTITVIAEGPGDYEYSINGIDYQDTPVFSYLDSGKYTIYIRDKNGCLPLYIDDTYVLDYPRFFTPNGDGTNDFWTIPYLSMRPGTVVTIFDRFGKIITGFNSTSHGWDGTFNGKPLPSTDYWFIIQLENRIVKGHFSMLR